MAKELIEFTISRNKVIFGISFICPLHVIIIVNLVELLLSEFKSILALFVKIIMNFARVDTIYEINI